MSFFKNLFSLFFVSRDEEVVEEKAAAPDPVAPGTNIRYHPELIDKLSDDHKLLLNLFGETSEAAARGDVVTAAGRLNAFRMALQGHLLTENVRLYVYLKHLFADDVRIYALVHEFRHEMDGIGKVLLDFLSKYHALAGHPGQADDFGRELAAIGKVLLERIKREEETLYPLYNG